MVELSMSVPRSDLLEFQRVMGLLQTHVGKTAEASTKIGAVFVAKALQAATSISPKNRKVIRSATEIVQNPKREAKWMRSGMFQYSVVRDGNKNKIEFVPLPGHFKTAAEARQMADSMGLLRIRMRGLARLLWWASAAKVQISQAGARPPTGGPRLLPGTRPRWRWYSMRRPGPRRR